MQQSSIHRRMRGARKLTADRRAGKCAVALQPEEPSAANKIRGKADWELIRQQPRL
jgi:hypothetical protein